MESEKMSLKQSIKKSIVLQALENKQVFDMIKVAESKQTKGILKRYFNNPVISSVSAGDNIKNKPTIYFLSSTYGELYDKYFDNFTGGLDYTIKVYLTVKLSSSLTEYQDYFSPLLIFSPIFKGFKEMFYGAEYNNSKSIFFCRKINKYYLVIEISMDF